MSACWPRRRKTDVLKAAVPSARIELLRWGWSRAVRRPGPALQRVARAVDLEQRGPAKPDIRPASVSASSHLSSWTAASRGAHPSHGSKNDTKKLFGSDDQRSLEIRRDRNGAAALRHDRQPGALHGLHDLHRCSACAAAAASRRDPGSACEAACDPHP